MALGLLLALYSGLIMAASMAGGLAPAMMRFTHRQLHLLMSLVAGLMLGVGVFHLLPHATEKLQFDVHAAAGWLMTGLLGMFFLIRAFHFHSTHRSNQTTHKLRAATPRANIPAASFTIMAIITTTITMRLTAMRVTETNHPQHTN